MITDEDREYVMAMARLSTPAHWEGLYCESLDRFIAQAAYPDQVSVTIWFGRQLERQEASIVYDILRRKRSEARKARTRGRGRIAR